jgi:hypothetical protein
MISITFLEYLVATTSIMSAISILFMINNMVNIATNNFIKLKHENKSLEEIKKKNYISENITQLSYSKIEECEIKKDEEIISTNKSYRGMLVDIWKTMPTQQILENTTFKIKLTNEYGNNGFKWNPDLNISFQDKNASETFKEILNMVKVNKMSINLSIKLKTGEIAYYNEAF